MRYYHSFPNVIPHARAGCSRVTHPSATNPSRRTSSFDLNVLCTPPAFILSQDQTLEQFVSQLPLVVNIFFIRAIYSSFTYFFLELYFSLVLTDFVFALAFFALYLFLLLFNCQGSIFSMPSDESLSIISQPLRFVNTFFEISLKNF